MQDFCYKLIPVKNGVLHSIFASTRFLTTRCMLMHSFCYDAGDTHSASLAAWRMVGEACYDLLKVLLLSLNTEHGTYPSSPGTAVRSLHHRPQTQIGTKPMHIARQKRSLKAWPNKCTTDNFTVDIVIAQ